MVPTAGNLHFLVHGTPVNPDGDRASQYLDAAETKAQCRDKKGDVKEHPERGELGAVAWFPRTKAEEGGGGGRHPGFVRLPPRARRAQSEASQDLAEASLLLLFCNVAHRWCIFFSLGRPIRLHHRGGEDGWALERITICRLLSLLGTTSVFERSTYVMTGKRPAFKWTETSR